MNHAALHAHRAAVFSEGDFDVRFRSFARPDSEHCGFQPSVIEERVDLLQRDALDLFDQRRDPGDGREVDVHGEPVILEIRKREENMVAGVREQAEVVSEVENKGFVVNFIARLGTDRLCL